MPSPDHPDSPKYVIAEKPTPNSCIVTWKPPAWDGGSNITNYIIERREHPMATWIRCGNTRFTVHESTGLTPGQTYSFRVIAENIYGKSPASDESAPVTTRETTKKKVQKRTYEGQCRAATYAL